MLYDHCIGTINKPVAVKSKSAKQVKQILRFRSSLTNGEISPSHTAEMGGLEHFISALCMSIVLILLILIALPPHKCL